MCYIELGEGSGWVFVIKVAACEVTKFRVYFLYIPLV